MFFFVEIRDFEHFSWTQVQDFSKNEQFFERSRCVFAIFHGFSNLERILARSRCIFRISLMKYRGFFNFSSIFADFDGSDSVLDAVLTRSRYANGIFRVRFS